MKKSDTTFSGGSGFETRGAMAKVKAILANNESQHQYGNKGSKPDKVDRSSASFYQNLIDYYFERRSDFDDGWRFCDDEYGYGRTVDHSNLEIEEIRPSRAYATVSTIEALVMANRPKLFVRGFTAKDEEQRAPVMEMAANNEWQQDSALVKETRLCVRDCARLGLAFALTSYEEEEEIDLEKQRKDAIKAKAAAGVDSVVAEAAALIQGEAAELEAASETPELTTNYEEDDRVVRNKAVTRRVSPWSIVVDPTATSEDDIKWIGRVLVCDLEAVKADKLLQNTEGLMPTSFDGEGAKHGRMRRLLERYNRDSGFPYDLVVLYEIFIRNADGTWSLRLFADGHDKFLREVDSPYWIGNPYRILRWNEDGESLFPQSDIQIIASEILAERVLLTKVFDGYSREQMDVTYYDTEIGLDEETLHVITDPDVGKLVGVPGRKDNQPLQNSFFKMPKDAKSPEALNLLAALAQSIQVSSGLSPNQQGQALKSGTTATEAAEVGSMARGRASHKFAAVEEFIAGIASDRMGIMAQHYSTTDIRRLVGKESAEKWANFNWTPGDVQNGMMIIVEPGSTMKQSEQSRINQMLSLIGSINQDPAIRAMHNMPALYNELYKRMGFHEASQFLQTTDGKEAGNMIAQIDAQSMVPGAGQPGPEAGIAAPPEGAEAQVAGGIG